MANHTPVSTVTGAFGLTGRYVTRRLLERGERVRTITGHPDRPNPFDAEIDVRQFRFDSPKALTESLQGTEVLYCTYWVRFERGKSTFDSAVRNLRLLFEAARGARVRRVVHVSIANAPASELPYYRGKAAVETALRESGLSFAIVRPTVLFGGRDILINNIAWLLRQFPLFAVPGDGQYRIQPIHVDDLAATMVDLGQSDENLSQDAGGPEVFSYEELVRLIARTIGRNPRLVHVPPAAALVAAKLIGVMRRDVVLSRDELRGLMASLLTCEPAPLATTRLSAYLREYAEEVGRQYASELERHYR